MIPLSFLCILGGMTTIIGSSTNLLVADALRTYAGKSLGFFDITPLGLILASIGALFILVFGDRLLPDRQPKEDKQRAEGEGKQFIAQIPITRGHPLIGSGSVAGLFPDLPDVTVRMIQRRDKALLPPFEDVSFRSGDVLIVAATRGTLTKLLKSKPEFLEDMMNAGPEPEEDSGGGAFDWLMLLLLSAIGLSTRRRS